MSFLEMLIVVLATWRVSSLLVQEDGPGEVFAKLRKSVGVYYNDFSEKTSDSLVGSLFICVWCMSVWVSFILVYLSWWGVFYNFVVIPLAVSGLVVFVHELIQRSRQ